VAGVRCRRRVLSQHRALAAGCGLAIIEDNAMPANNRLLVFRKEN